MAHRDRKVHSQRGKRTSGHGGAQKHRGSGSRGGRGNAGTLKHKQIKTIKTGRVFGKVGFKRHQSLIKKANTINVSEIDRSVEVWLSEDKAKKTSGGFSVDLTPLGYDKVLGGGKITRKIDITAASFSAFAKSKIEAAGGKAIGGDGFDTA
jgi:large subunit ribosomal protein L15